jgi:hypothetical protein
MDRETLQLQEMLHKAQVRLPSGISTATRQATTVGGCICCATVEKALDQPRVSVSMHVGSAQQCATAGGTTGV